LLSKIRKVVYPLTGLKKPSRRFSPTAGLAYAFGVKETVVRTCDIKEESNNGSTKRKRRSDAGLTLFNSHQRREQVWTEKMYYAKKQRVMNRGEGLTQEEIDTGFAQLAAEVPSWS
jgi:hypothetical protein